MNSEIALSLSIFAIAVVLFISERLRVDLVALLVLVSLSLTGLVTPTEAFSGFSNPAVITVWAVFILSAGLTRTGIAKAVGRRVLKVAGSGVARLTIVIMLTAGVMSAFMNNIGVAVMLLPVVVDIARRTKLPPSKLLMPLAFGSQLGGLTTIIGTPTNILASNALEEYGFAPLNFFDFAPLGGAVAITGILFMVFIGKRLLPSSALVRDLQNPGELFDLSERLFYLILPKDSPLAGKTLATCRLGSALSLNVLAIIRNGETQLSPSPSDLLVGGDKLLVSGRTSRLKELEQGNHLSIDSGDEDLSKLAVDLLTSNEVGMAELQIRSKSSLNGKTIAEIDFRTRFGALVLAIMNNGSVVRTDLQDLTISADDTLLIQFPPEVLEQLEDSEDFVISQTEETEVYHLQERLHIMQLPEESHLDGKTLIESRFGTGFGLGVLSIIRNGETILMPEANEKLRSGDKLVIRGKVEDLSVLEGLQTLQYEEKANLDDLESDEVGMSEIVISPHSRLDGKTLRQINFREKFGLSVLAIWRGGRAYRHKLRNMPLRFGDALLLHGPRHKMSLLANEADFIVLTEEAAKTTRTAKAPIALLIMAAVVLSVGLGYLPIAIAAVTGAALMVLSGGVSMEEAYRAIEWQAVFLIAGMLPLGIAMETSGAAAYLGAAVVTYIGPFGPTALLAGIFALTMLATQVMPNPVVLVLVAPIALSTAVGLNMSPTAVIILVALAACTTFLSPVGHPANILIMGPAGYRFKDFIKVGIPLTLVIMVVSLLLLPIFWPLILP
ncbi:MAG: SLC13 family permease [Chloroflexota bacterium]